MRLAGILCLSLVSALCASIFRSSPEITIGAVQNIETNTNFTLPETHVQFDKSTTHISNDIFKESFVTFQFKLVNENGTDIRHIYTQTINAVNGKIKSPVLVIPTFDLVLPQTVRWSISARLRNRPFFCRESTELSKPLKIVKGIKNVSFDDEFFQANKFTSKESKDTLILSEGNCSMFRIYPDGKSIFGSCNK
jgi:hypothetical protein